MKLLAVVTAVLALLFASGALGAQQPRFSGKYEELTPRQQELVKLWSSEYQKIFNRPSDPATMYDRMPLSARTTFEAVTHALSRSQMTSGSGKAYGTALDLVDLVERVAGAIPGGRGDSQYRVFVYLKAGAVDKLYNSREFKRDSDNTVFHIGYPVNFRQQGGVPSIQISVTRTGRRADIDVDYRPSGGIKALTSGHLSAANSDVRAGNNHQKHVARWEGFGEWWRSLMARLLKEPVEAEAGFTSEASQEIEAKLHGPLPEMIHTTLTEWLIKEQPAGLLPLVSVKAYPCVAEFGDGSRPDSKMALLRILNQFRQVNQRLAKVNSLESAVIPAEYPLPESEAVKHAHSQLFTIQRVHDDIAWAIDCRIRYGLNLVESLPKPEHRMDETFVASFKLNVPKEPVFLVQTWQKENGAWKLTSFDIKRNSVAPRTDLLTRAANPADSKPADSKLQATVEKFLTAWFIDRRLDDATALFLPESYACDAMAETRTSRATAKSNGNVRKFLEETADQSAKEKTLERIVAAAQAGHQELKPLTHSRDGAYLMAEASGGLMRMNACEAGAPARTAAKNSADQAGGILTAFHLSRSKQESAGIISLYWKYTNGDWRIASFTLSAD